MTRFSVLQYQAHSSSGAYTLLSIPERASHHYTTSLSPNFQSHPVTVIKVSLFSVTVLTVVPYIFIVHYSSNYRIHEGKPLLSKKHHLFGNPFYICPSEVVASRWKIGIPTLIPQDQLPYRRLSSIMTPHMATQDTSTPFLPVSSLKFIICSSSIPPYTVHRVTLSGPGSCIIGYCGPFLTVDSTL